MNISQTSGKFKDLPELRRTFSNLLEMRKITTIV